jgi:chromosomal replication initiator protein
LLHAIGNEYIKRFPEKNIRYVTTDEFVREMYNGISHGDNEVEHLKDRYQAYDLLLIDDIQFLSKKDKANEIFFNILNNNVSRNQIIVMTSDKAPSQLEHFEDRMKSRFHSGLVIQITQPDLNAIKTILQEKIKESGEGFQFTKEATDYIAHRNNHDIRHLEGFLHKVLFYALNNLPPRAVITLNVITGSVDQERQDAMRDLGYDVDPNVVIAQICAAYNIDPHIVKSKARTRQATMVRHVCMYVLRQKLNMPYAQIGSYFSGRDHSTIMDSIQKIENMIKKDEELKNFILNLCKKI